MTAADLKQLSITSCSKEITRFEKLMVEASGKGELSITIDKISDAARVHFLSQGFEVKIILDMKEENKEKPPQWKIIWQNAK